MRIGMAIGGLFLMFIGFLLTITFIFFFFGVLLGFVGFVMFIVGLVTSYPARRSYRYPQPGYPSEQPYVPQQQYMSPAGIRYCTNCGAPNTREALYCSHCGTKLAQ